MTPFWLWVGAGCVACGLAGFSTVRLAARRLMAVPQEAPQATRSATPPTATVDASASAVRARPPGPAAPRTRKIALAKATPAPTPTADRPEAEKLALWARQVRAGERKMSVATDGCRVTWNRVCKHGHPSWLVHLGYLKPRPPLERHTPR